MINEMDILIAEKVMGWRKKAYVHDSFFVYYLGDREMEVYDFYPSHQIVDAWIVLEELQKKFGGFNLHKDKTGIYHCEILWWNEGAFDVIADERANEAPEAICKAALKAVHDLVSP